MAYDLVTGDTLPTLRVTVKDEEGAAFDMTGMTAKFRWKDASDAVVEKTATIAASVASYQFAVNDIIAPKMKIELEITTAEGKIVTTPNLIVLNVREQVA